MNAGLFFEASCVGGVPIIRTLLDGVQGNKIEQMMGIILSTLITLTFVSLLYGIMSHQLRGWNNIISSLYTGFGTYGVWILVVMTATLLYDTILFALIPL